MQLFSYDGKLIVLDINIDAWGQRIATRRIFASNEEIHSAIQEQPPTIFSDLQNFISSNAQISANFNTANNVSSENISPSPNKPTFTFW